ncbi:MAG: YdeI/OmpD-associated family protein [Candidatus Yanofskybacteria bacterium]|nr:YdeI/OmpD-associated family protein [Candidatus Yanofskybacteria bacterium]
MKIGRKIYVTTAAQWRAWLTKNHATAREVWLVYYKVGSGKPRISYNDAVEQALCFGWIDSTAKSIDALRFAQRFSPRQDPTNWSQHNIERMHRMIASKQMTPAGLAAFKHHTPLSKTKRLVLAPDVKAALTRDPAVWRAFMAFPASYRRIRIAAIEHYRARGAAAFTKRLAHFVKRTKAGKRIGFGHGE